MKKIITTIGLIGTFLSHSCTKQELVTVNDPIELDENSRQYQEYMVERAIYSIKVYRFERLGDIVPRIKDPEMRAKVDALYAEYRAKAKADVLYIVTPKNDTLFFKPYAANDAKNFSEDFEPGFWNSFRYGAVINVEGVLQGFQNYPNVTSFSISNSLATGLKGLEFMPKMTRFQWNRPITFDLDKLKDRHPEREFAPFKLKADLSQNHKLESIDLQYVDMSDMVFPSHKLKKFSLGGGSIVSHNLNSVNAEEITVSRSQSAALELSLSNTVGKISLEDISGLRKLDLKNMKVDETIVLKALPDIEELILPEVMTGGLSIRTPSLKKLDLKDANGMGNLGLEMPDLEELTLPDAIMGNLNLQLPLVEELALPSSIKGKMTIMTSKLKKLDMKNVKGIEGGFTLWLNDKIEELTLPDGITDQLLAKSSLLFKKGIIIHNVPAGVDIEKYVRYYQQ